MLYLKNISSNIKMETFVFPTNLYETIVRIQKSRLREIHGYEYDMINNRIKHVEATYIIIIPRDGFAQVMMDLHAMTDANTEKMDTALDSIGLSIDSRWTDLAGGIHGNWAQE